MHKKFVKFDHVVFELREWTDGHTHHSTSVHALREAK